MLYQIYETQRSLMEPFADFAQAASKMYSNPLSPFGQNPFAQRVSAGYDLMYRLGKDYEKPEFGLRTVNVEGTEVAIHERVEIDKPFCELRRFKRFTDDPATLTRLKGQPAVLIVAPLSGHYATLLRDTVRTMLKDHKVYITDWKNARTVPLSEGEFHLDDYVNYVQEFIRHLQGIYGNCHVISVCQPTVPVLAAVSLMASRKGETTPLSMTMMGGPIDARKSPTAVNNLAMNKSHSWFENNVIYRVPSNFPGAGRRVYPGFLQHTGFVAMNPDKPCQEPLRLLQGPDQGRRRQHRSPPQVLRRIQRRARHGRRLLPGNHQGRVPGVCKLVNGTWDVKGVDGKLERVRPQDITTTAHFTVEGELDDISGSGQTEAAHGLCSGVPKARQKHLEVKGAGHYGIFSGRRWRDIVYPQVKAFILAHNAPEKAAPLPCGQTCQGRQNGQACGQTGRSSQKSPCPARNCPPVSRREPAGRAHQRRTTANAVHALRLPRLRGLRAGDCRRRSAHQPVPTRRGRGHSPPGSADGPSCHRAEPHQRRRSPAHPGGH
jgi:poly(3-hydroxybutyrate) depolymerase